MSAKEKLKGMRVKVKDNKSAIVIALLIALGIIGADLEAQGDDPNACFDEWAHCTSDTDPHWTAYWWGQGWCVYAISDGRVPQDEPGFCAEQVAGYVMPAEAPAPAAPVIVAPTPTAEPAPDWVCADLLHYQEGRALYLENLERVRARRSRESFIIWRDKHNPSYTRERPAGLPVGMRLEGAHDYILDSGCGDEYEALAVRESVARAARGGG